MFIKINDEYYNTNNIIKVWDSSTSGIRILFVGDHEVHTTEWSAAYMFASSIREKLGYLHRGHII